MPVPSPDKWRGLRQERHPRRKNFCQIIQIRYFDKSIPDRSRPGLPTTVSGVARQGTCGNYATAGLSENKRRKASEETAGNAEGETHIYKGRYLKYRNNDRKGREVADMMERRM